MRRIVDATRLSDLTSKPLWMRRPPCCSERLPHLQITPFNRHLKKNNANQEMNPLRRLLRWSPKVR